MTAEAAPYGCNFDNMSLQVAYEDLQAVREIVRQHQPKTIVEIGVWAGCTTVLLAEHGATVYSVDHWQGTPTDGCSRMIRLYGHERALSIFCQNMGDRLFRQVFPCVGSSREWANRWPFQVDMVYIDAGHTFEECCSDILQWKRHVKPGGIIAGHDYDEQWFPGVIKAVDHCLGGPDLVYANVWVKQLSQHVTQPGDANGSA